MNLAVIMTREIAFECLLVSDDPAVLRTMDPLLHDFSISTNVCPQSERTGDWLEKRGAHLVVLDLEAESSSDALRQLQESRIKPRPTVLAVSAADRVVPGVNVVLRKPVTHESGIKSLKAAYFSMLQDFRKHTRFALMEYVIATDENNRTFSLNVVNVGAGGVGIKTNVEIAIGSVLSFRLKLPLTEGEISVRCRLLWSRPSGVAGCEFVRMSPRDLQLLHDWLESRYQIKQPITTIT